MPHDTQHTPGPWSACMPRGETGISIDAVSNEHIARVSLSNRDTLRACADARLIAAAPDLLAASEAALVPIKEAWARQCDGADIWPVLESLRAAINKARRGKPDID